MLSGTSMIGTDTTADQFSNADFMTIGAHIRRELSGGRFVFTDFQTSTATGFLSNNKSVFAVGVEYPLNQILGLKIDWRMINYTDTESSSNDYRANMLNAQIGARFR
jgi:hypothetical protein